MSTRQSVCVLVVALALGGCSSRAGVWEKPGGDQAAFDRDRYACLIDSKTGDGGFDDRIFNACMGAKGYFER